MLPFSRCCAHVGGEGWGRQAVSFADAQVRAYVVDLTPAQIGERLAKEGAARAGRFAKRVAATQGREGDWSRAAVDYDLFYGDYGGTARVDTYSRSFGRETVVLVFLHVERGDTKSVREILESFAWERTE